MSLDNDNTVINATLPVVKAFEETGIANFGNSIISALLKQIAFDDELEGLKEAAEESRGLIGFNLTKAVMELQQTDEKVNIYAIWEGGRATEKLNTRLLVKMGVMSRVADEESDAVIYKWSDPANEAQYNYSAIDKDKDEPEYTRRHNNRKRLNIALSNACKSAIALIDGGTKAEDLKIVDEGDGAKAVIENAPKSLVGEDKSNKVEFGKRTVNTGATHSPTMASLVKIATQKHKVEDEGQTGERADKGNERSGEAKLAMTDEAFGGMVNTLKRAILAQEGKFTPDMIKQLRSMSTTIAETLAVIDKAAANAKAAKAAAKAQA